MHKVFSLTFSPRKAGWLFGCFAAFWGCSAPETAQVERAFDLPAFFQAEQKRLDALSIQVLKTVEVNGRLAAYNTDTIRWVHELALPASLDLNKPAWIGKYREERVSTGNEKTLRYFPTDQNIPLRFAEVRLDAEGRLQSAEGYRTESSLITETSVHWWYYPDSLYRIMGTERLRGLQPNRYSVEGRLVGSSR